VHFAQLLLAAGDLHDLFAGDAISSQRRPLSYVLVKVKEGQNPAEVCARINRETGLLAQTADQYSQSTLDFVNRSTGIAVNFGMAIALGFVVGAAIAGQTFYNFTLDNLKYFAALKAMGASARDDAANDPDPGAGGGIAGLWTGRGRARCLEIWPGEALAFRMSYSLLAEAHWRL
jgi:putative ABC transport system permease protein